MMVPFRQGGTIIVVPAHFRSPELGGGLLAKSFVT
jgi:hypothetical protein